MTTIQIQSLPEFFFPLVRDAFHKNNIYEIKDAAYVTGVLNKFARTWRLYAPLGEKGTEEWQTPYIHEMLMGIEQLPVGIGDLVRQHMGDYTLFMLGMFPRRVRKLGRWNLYVGAGKGSYRDISCHYERDTNTVELADLFSRLSDNFEAGADALNYMRQNHLELGDEIPLEIRQFINSIRDDSF